MECVCVVQYNEIKPGSKFEISEIYTDYYILTSPIGWTMEVSNKWFNKCFKVNDLT